MGLFVGGGLVGYTHCFVLGFFTLPNWQTHSAKASSSVLVSIQFENSGQYIPSQGLFQEIKLWKYYIRYSYAYKALLDKIMIKVVPPCAIFPTPSIAAFNIFKIFVIEIRIIGTFYRYNRLFRVIGIGKIFCTHCSSLWQISKCLKRQYMGISIIYNNRKVVRIRIWNVRNLPSSFLSRIL